MEYQTRTIEVVDNYLKEIPEDIQEITNTIRKLIFNASLLLKEEYKWSMPNYSYNGLVCYLQPSKKHVNLGFHRGNDLQRFVVNGLLEGSGKSMRHITVQTLEDIQPEKFTALIKIAVGLNHD